MSKAASTGLHRVPQKCPSCGNREPKEVVKIEGRKRLYCVACGKDFGQKSTFGVFAFFFAALALMFAFGVVKQRLPQGGNRDSQHEFVEIDGVTTNAGGETNWTPLREGEIIPNGGRKLPKKKEDPMSASEKEIRKQWGWDSKGTSLDQPAR